MLTAALVSVVPLPFTMMGSQAGILQGERRWQALSVVYVLSGVPRLLIGTALIAWHPPRPPRSSAPASAPASGGRRLVVPAPAARRRRAHRGHGFRRVIRESFHNSHVLLAFFALSNVDIVIARNVLPEHDAGLYAGG